MTYPPLTRGQLQIIEKALAKKSYPKLYTPLAARIGVTREELIYHLKIHGFYRKDTTSEDAVPLDNMPTNEQPGSEGKIRVLADRAARRVALFHPEDEKLITRVGNSRNT